MKDKQHMLLPNHVKMQVLYLVLLLSFVSDIQSQNILPIPQVRQRCPRLPNNFDVDD